MDKQYYADKIHELVEQAKQDNIRICTYIVGASDVKSVGIAISEINSDDVAEMTLISL